MMDNVLFEIAMLFLPKNSQSIYFLCGLLLILHHNSLAILNLDLAQTVTLCIVVCLYCLESYGNLLAIQYFHETISCLQSRDNTFSGGGCRYDEILVGDDMKIVVLYQNIDKFSLYLAQCVIVSYCIAQ